MDKPMMKCGHAASAACSAKEGITFSPPIPSCAICNCIDVADSVPDLTGRIAKCAYRDCKKTWERMRDTHYGEFGPDGQSFAPSDMKLPFFEHKPTEPFDRYFCGCFGWD